MSPTNETPAERRAPYATLTLRQPRIGAEPDDPRRELVEDLQYRLRRWPYGRDVIFDGVFGPQTAAAVQKALWYLGEREPLCRPAITPMQLIYVMGARRLPLAWTLRRPARHGKPVPESIAYDPAVELEDFMPEIVARDAWAQIPSRRPKLRERVLRSAWRSPTMFVHYIGPGFAAVGGPNAERLQVQSFLRTHMLGNNWTDLGYHWYIGRSGTIFQGRAPGDYGAHSGVTWANRNPGVCLDHGTGNIAAGDFVTAEQIRSLLWLFAETNSTRAMGHREVKSTACPGNPLMNLVAANRTMRVDGIAWDKLPKADADAWVPLAA